MHRFLRRSFLLSSRIPHYCRSSSSGTPKGEQSSESYVWVKDGDISDKLKKLVPIYSNIEWSHEETFSFSSFKLCGPKEEIESVAAELKKCFKDGCIKLFPCRSPFEKPANTAPHFIDVTLTFNEELEGLWVNIINTTNFPDLASKISKRDEFDCIGSPDVNIIVKEHIPTLYGSVKSYNIKSLSSDFKPVINISVTHNICNGETEVGYVVKQVIQDMFCNYFVTIDSVSSPTTAVCSRDCSKKE
ncbi:PREDICTED: uncharacterized protein LOC100632207 [Amphimedon queenslandica]|uniref:Uncharacterized protein n=1 Tax=Amphimedon queenslandica TaxID=400682 RepID=A0A1X7U8S8_AMPQE|nr:PREDICTED: uncharacterized protein LOC100632207 [Amphimedon queenslandica]|eukprot:XP_019855426.1 PREDICTED: uncharacterized protein LOC100632207 [Amphimedon queenslandica]